MYLIKLIRLFLIMLLVFFLQNDTNRKRLVELQDEIKRLSEEQVSIQLEVLFQCFSDINNI